MTDPKTRANGGDGPTKTNSASKGSKLQAILKQLSGSAKDLSSEMERLNGLEKQAEERKQLAVAVQNKSNELAERDAEIQKLKTELSQERKARTGLIEGFEARCLLHGEVLGDTKNLQSKLEKAHDTIKTKDGELNNISRARVQLQQELDQARKERTNLSTALEGKERSYSLQQALLHKSQFELQEIRKDIGSDQLRRLSDQEMEEIRQGILKLAADCQGIVADFLSQEYCDARDLERLFIEANLPLPPSTSPNATLMYRAGVRTKIADILSTSIFSPFYIQGDAQDAAELIAAHLDGKALNLFRSMLRASPLTDEESSTVAVNKAREDIYRCMISFTAPTDIISLRNRILNLVRSASAIWTRVQESEDFVYVEDLTSGFDDSFDGTDGPLGCDEFGTSPPQDDQTAVADYPKAILTLFPRVATESGRVLHPGIALWSDQPAVLAVRREVEGASPRGRAGHGGSAFRRRLSVSSTLSVK